MTPLITLLLTFTLATPAVAGLLDELAAVETPSGAAAAQSGDRGVQLTPDERHILVQADVGDERWAVALDTADTLTGNVFFRSGRRPVFLWCVALERIGSVPSGRTRFGCTSAEACAPNFCPQFEFVSNQVWLNDSFFLP